jgi:hypothetical protein
LESMAVVSSKIKSVRKRDGRVVAYDGSKISEAIWKAIKATGGKDKSIAIELAAKVNEILEKRFGDGAVPSVEDVQDAVEHVLIEGGYAKTAKAYILYRQKRAEIREEKMKILEKLDIDEVDKSFDSNALKVLRARYLRKDENGHVLGLPAVHLIVGDGRSHLRLTSQLYDVIVSEPSNPWMAGIAALFTQEFFGKPADSNCSVNGNPASFALVSNDPGAADAGIELILQDGRRLRISKGVDEETLRAVLAAVGSAQC